MHRRFILPLIVIAQFCCTSLWFAGNGVMADLVTTFDLSDSALGNLTSFVQFGFIAGTLAFATLTIADRFSPSRVFFVSAILGALFNLGVIWGGNTIVSLLALRFLTGFFLAGIYPVGMKIATDYFEKGLGKSLGFLVGALVIGTAFPHLLKGYSASISWEWLIVATSALASLGGVLMVLFVPNGPYRTAGKGVDLSAFFRVFDNKKFRAAAFGYFGHMWELYAFWAFVPVILSTYNTLHPAAGLNVARWSFFIIAIGGIACVIGGYLAQKIGTKKTASVALLLSGMCCLLVPFMFGLAHAGVFIGFLLFWGMVVIADSPLFSTLVAQNASPAIKGTALTIVNCIGFSITIISIQLLAFLNEHTDTYFFYAMLVVGPILGLWALYGEGAKSTG
ncbi:MAG: nitrate/nitrite transporter [Bacteroidia bacterium]